jgi:DNA-binding GntR family transcriptional regulator
MEKPALLVNYPNLGDKVYEAIRDQIVTCEFAPGSQLGVADLSRQLGVSLTPVRDAINRLMAERLVEDVPRRGYFVARLDPEGITDLLGARRLIELAAVEEGIDRIEPGQLDDMRRLAAEMEQLVDRDGRYVDYAEFSKRDSQFHLLLVGSAGNRHLVEIYRGLSVHVHIHRTNLVAQAGYSRGAATAREHRSILESFERRDLTAARAAITEHVQAVTREFGDVDLSRAKSV